MTQSKMSAEGKVAREVSFKRTRRVLIAASGIPIGLGILHVIQPDLLAAISLLPRWGWLIPGLLIQVFTARAFRLREWQILILLWICYLLMFVEESHSLCRCLIPAESLEESSSVRVLTLNCAGIDQGILEELRAQKPDLILLQEVPSEDRVRGWASELFGSEGDFIRGIDCCILARGKLSSIGNSREQSFIQGLWQFSSDQQIRVVSLRLATPPIRLDPWNGDFWIEYSEIRDRQKSELQPLIEQQHLFKEASGAILGGDYNSPATDPSDDVLHELGLKDPFDCSGRGWGNTMTNAFPLHRIDRFMTSNHLKPVCVKAIKSAHSDHRLVVCDLKIAR